MKSKVNLAAILIFYIVAISLRYLTNKTAFLSIVPNEYLKAILHGIGPAIGALLVFKLFKIKPVLSLKGNYKQLLFPFALFWVLPIALISATAYFKNGTLPLLSVSSILIYGLLEEIGWRGFLQQALEPLPKFAGILIIAVLWFIWHLNFDFTVSNLLFFGILFLGSWGIGKVADSTHSLLAVAAFHSLNNFFHQLDTTKIILLVILLSVWIAALVYQKKRKETASQ